MDGAADLSEPERALLEDLSVFAGGFTEEAAQAVARANPVTRGLLAEDLLARLRARSLVTARPGGRHAVRKPVPSPDDGSRSRHLDWARATAEAGAAALDGPAQAAHLDALEAEHDNFRAALDWGTARRDNEPALALAAALGRFWEVRGHVREGRRYLDAARRNNPGAAAGVRANAANSAGLLALRDHDYAGAKSIYDESLALHWELGDRLGSTGVLHALGNVAFQERDWDEARRLFEESLTIGREVRDDRVVAASLTNLGAVAETAGDRSEARTLYVEALALWRTIGDRFNAAAVLANLADLAVADGDLSTARLLGGEALEARRVVGDKAGMEGALRRLAMVAYKQGDLEAARAFESERKQLGGRRPSGRRSIWPWGGGR